MVNIGYIVLKHKSYINLLCTVEQGGAESIDNPMHEAAKRGMIYFTSV